MKTFALNKDTIYRFRFCLNFFFSGLMIELFFVFHVLPFDQGLADSLQGISKSE